MYDVKQVANILEVSKKTVYKYLKDHEKELQEYISSKKRKKIINNQGLEVLAKLSDRQDKLNDYIQKQQNDKGVTTTKDKLKENQSKDNDYIELLKETIENLEKDKQDLKQDKQDLKKQINELTRLLDQQQQLTLIGSPKENNKKDREETKNKNIFSTFINFFR